MRVSKSAKPRAVVKPVTSVATAPAPGWPLWLIGLAFFGLLLLAYAPALNGRPIWDDEAHLTKVELRSLGGLARIWVEPGATQQYYPLVHSAFWVGWKIWGGAVLPYHLTNVFLHALSATLLVSILRRLEIPAALLAGAIFALHPVQVESVAWMSELKNTLSGFFALSAALFYLRFDERRKAADYVFALGLFALGLISKSVIATLPAALLVIFWWKRGKLSRAKDVWPLLPFFVAGVGSGAFTAWVEHNYIGAQGAAFDYSLGERVLLAGRVFWFYLAKLFWPARLTFVYPRWEISAASWWQYLFPLAALSLLALGWLLRGRTRAPLAALLLFGGMLFPVLGFVNVYPFLYSFVADHFQYLASIAVIAFSSAGLTLLLRRFQIGNRAAGSALAGLLVSLLAFLTWRQARMYRDAETLYTVTLERNPACWMAHNNLSVALLARGDADGAIEHSEQALALKPDDHQPHISLGDALVRKQRLDEAVSHFRTALQLRPDYVETHTHLGAALLVQKRFGEAIAEYETTLQKTPNSLYANNNLAWVLSTCPDVSFRDGPRALRLSELANRLAGGENPAVLRTLAAANAQSGQLPRAIEIAQRALQLTSPDDNLNRTLQKEIALYRSHLR